MKRMELRKKQWSLHTPTNKSQQKIIHALAQDGKMTMYKIKHKTSLAHSSVHEAIKGKFGLVYKGLVEPVEVTTWRTDKERKVYDLTLLGLNVFFGKSKNKRDLRHAIKMHKDKHIFFEFWDELVNSIEFPHNVYTLYEVLPKNDIYDILRSVDLVGCFFELHDFKMAFTYGFLKKLGEVTIKNPVPEVFDHMVDTIRQKAMLNDIEIKHLEKIVNCFGK